MSFERAFPPLSEPSPLLLLGIALERLGGAMQVSAMDAMDGNRLRQTITIDRTPTGWAVRLLGPTAHRNEEGPVMDAEVIPQSTLTGYTEEL